MNSLKIEEKNGFKFIKGDFRKEIENDELNGLHLINCEIEDYDADGVYFETTGFSKVYYTNEIGEIEQVLYDDNNVNEEL